eukprot:322625-Prorocentrum_minimum.AAC.1
MFIIIILNWHLSSLTLRGILPGTPRRGIASHESSAEIRPGGSLRSAGTEIRPGVGARPGNVN